MAINNGRYVVTGGYMDPSGRIVEETQYVPGTTTSYPSSNMFSNAEAFGLQAKGYADLGDNAMAAAYGDIANNLGRYSTFANTSVDTADKLLNFMRQNEAGLQGAAGKLYNQLTGDIQSQRQYIMDTFGPEGTLTKEVNKYYDDLGNYLATDAGRQAANIAAQGVHSGASLGAIRAQQNEAYNESFGRYVQAKEQEINAKQQIASNLINYMSALRQEYGDTTNQYIIELYKRANDMYNNVAQSVAADLDQYNALRYASTGSGSGGGTSYSDLVSQYLASQGADATAGQGGTTTTITDPANKNGTNNTVVNNTSGNSGTARQTPNYLGALGWVMNPMVMGTMGVTNWITNKIADGLNNNK